MAVITRHIAFGDLHGCLEEFKELLKRLEFNQTNDKLWICGDITDRGPQSTETVTFIQELYQKGCLLSVQGNHDNRHVRFWRHEKKRKLDTTYVNPMQGFIEDKEKMQVFNSLSESNLEFLASLPYYIRINENWVIVHAGFMPSVPLKKQNKDVMTHVRHVSLAEKKCINLTADKKQPKDTCYWYEKWQGPENVIFGHDAKRDIVIHESKPGVFCYGIDTGICFGGKLTAFILETKEFVQVVCIKKWTYDEGWESQLKSV